MWVVGDWGQNSPWSRTTGVKMVKGANDVYTGELSLPKGTKFDIRILKSTVSTTSGGDNTWSAVKYESTLNISALHDFGEFTDNLIPNGNFEEGTVKWTPAESILNRDYAHGGGYIMAVGGDRADTISSDTFTIPPNQNLICSYYVRAGYHMQPVTVEVKDVDTQAVLFEDHRKTASVDTWIACAGEFVTGSLPVKAQVVCTSDTGDVLMFDDMSLVMP